MNNSITLLLILILGGAQIIGGCSGVYSQDENSNHTQETAATIETQENNHGENESVHLTDRQMQTAGIKTGAIQQLPLSNSIKVNGYLELPPQNKANVSAILGGLVETIYVREGDQVAAGDVLADLADPKFSELQSKYREAASGIAYLEEDFKRKERLLENEVGSQRELQKAKAEYESAVAQKQSLQSTLAMLGLDTEGILDGEFFETVPLKAPISGFVRVVETNTGRYADPNSNLFEIVDNEHIHIDLLVYEKDIHQVKDDQEVLFKYTNQPNDQFYRARIFSVGKAFEDNPRAVRVHAEIEDRQDGLLPGMFVDGRIITSTETTAVLPDEAIVRNGSEYLVFALKDGESDEGHSHAHEGEDVEMEFSVVQINTGTTDAGYTEVEFFESLPENSQFVTKGAYYLLAEMKKGEGGHDH
ncbi:MAG: efflux RND transporter periplasmic adaptor subunit [Balneolales bacterium]